MRIFIAGPYGDHNPKDVIAANVARADQMARDLTAKGHKVFCPHKMTWGWEDDERLTRGEILESDRSFIIYWASAVFRIPGNSPGADDEVALAGSLRLPVYYRLEDVPK